MATVQPVLALGIALITVIGLTIRSWQANARFQSFARLPMQWSIKGNVNWTAPRVVALAFTPVLAAVIMIATAVFAFFVAPRPGQEDDLVPVTILMAFMFVGVQALHLSLIGKTLDRSDH